MSRFSFFENEKNCKMTCNNNLTPLISQDLGNSSCSFENNKCLAGFQERKNPENESFECSFLESSLEIDDASALDSEEKEEWSQLVHHLEEMLQTYSEGNQKILIANCMKNAPNQNQNQNQPNKNQQTKPLLPKNTSQNNQKKMSFSQEKTSTQKTSSYELYKKLNSFLKSKNTTLKGNRYDILFLEGENFLRKLFLEFECSKLPIESDVFLVQTVLSSLLEIKENPVIVLSNLLKFLEVNKLKNKSSKKTNEPQKDRLKDFIDNLNKIPYHSFCDIVMDKKRLKQDIAELAEMQKHFNFEKTLDKNLLNMLKDKNILIADINFEIQNDQNKSAFINFPIKLKKREWLSFSDSSTNAQEKCRNQQNDAYSQFATSVNSSELSKLMREIKGNINHSEKAFYLNA